MLHPLKKIGLKNTSLKEFSILPKGKKNNIEGRKTETWIIAQPTFQLEFGDR